jgi:L-rhamnose mutarotase
VADYVLAHRAVPAELVDLYRAAGIRNFSAFVKGRDLLLYWECEDPEASRRAIQGRAIEERWQALMDPLIDPAEETPCGEGPPDWDEVFHFD